MSTTAEVLLRVQVKDTNGQLVLARDVATTLASVLSANGKLETVTLSAGFTALSPPTGAHAVILIPVSGAFTYTLKGVTGDTGTVWSTTTLPALPVLIGLGTSPSIGITCTGAGVVEVIWL